MFKTANFFLESLFLRKVNKPQQTRFNPATSNKESSNIRSSPLSQPAGEVLFSDIQNNPIQTIQNNSNTINTNRSAIPESEFETNNSNNTNLNNSQNNQEDEAELQQRREVFPCHHPINPHMQNREVRLQTFIDRSETWPRHRINATPQEIADAGFFYLGRFMYSFT